MKLAPVDAAIMRKGNFGHRIVYPVSGGRGMTALNRKYSILRKIIADLRTLVVAFSGGVDSSLLLRVAHDVLVKEPCRVRLTVPAAEQSTERGKFPRTALLAVTAMSPIYPRRELVAARRIARLIGAKHIVIHTEELANRRFTTNPRERCFYCKSELFRRLARIAQQHGIEHVADGTNVDDMSDFRPGRKAAAKFGVVSPLLEAGLGKRDIRTLAKRLGLPNWREPAHACLASRIPYGTRITPAALRRVESAETFLASLGFTQIRVRDHWPVARIELAPREISRAVAKQTRRRIVARLKTIGYTYVALDIEGYRTGSMNEKAKKRENE